MISIIVPVYKVENYLSKCIESLLAQTYKNIEIILVDDGSPDRCPAICDKFAERDDRVKVIHQNNQGVSFARNVGLEIAKGEYVGFCDPDDFVEKQMYEEMLTAMIESQSQLIICGYNYYDENYNIDSSRIYNVRENEELTLEDIYRKLSENPPSIRHGVVNKLFLKAIVDKVHFDVNLRSAEDGNFLLDYLYYVSKATFVHKPLYGNLVRNGSATHGGLDTESLMNSFSVHDRMYRETVARYPRLHSIAISYLLDVCTLKYNEVKRTNSDAKRVIKYMRSYLRSMSIKGLNSSHIYWKTKIYYLLLWIRK